ncbi:hypothetical protein IP81_17865 [Novosphingobium sp. AAP83]|uniref:hypothetical protein n=1 Tax=Novosphingobium sp. AAP83 TaxID=1523425 RepID=UPI0006B9060B|nr:hypothetical protein [Novosphingobium sp. AAP83]KPF88653.1 hypothetical protein IP81_17865 [Novosphingobium sp. AAP83]
MSQGYDGLNDLPDALTPKLLIFLSADVIGSTALKQPDRNKRFSPGSAEANVDIEPLSVVDPIDWLALFREFYARMASSLARQWLSYEDGLKNRPGGAECVENFLGSAPVFWKTVGDEVIFYKELTGSAQIHAVIECWILALNEIRAYFDSQNAVIEAANAQCLDVKSSAWIAEFPRRNREVALPYLPGSMVTEPAFSPNGKSSPTDFIGPGIDIGFRISSLATSQKLVLSLDVAYILAKSRPDAFIAKRSRPIYYDGRFFFKGVFGEKRYPIFWLNISKPDSVDHREVLVQRDIQRDDVIDLCDHYYRSQYHEFTHKPFIWRDKSLHLAEVPEFYLQWLRKAKEELWQTAAATKQSQSVADAALPDQINDKKARRDVLADFNEQITATTGIDQKELP